MYFFKFTFQNEEIQKAVFDGISFLKKVKVKNTIEHAYLSQGMI